MRVEITSPWAALGIVLVFIAYLAWSTIGLAVGRVAYEQAAEMESDGVRLRDLIFPLDLDSIWVIIFLPWVAAGLYRHHREQKAAAR